MKICGKQLGFVCSVVMTLTAGLPEAARAEGGVLMTSLICQDPRDSVDSIWAARKFGATDVYFMETDGTVSALSAAAEFSSHEATYITSHGNENGVGTIPKADFATFYKAAHPDTPKVVYFDTCSSAKGGNTVLKLTNAQYDNKVEALYGPKSACQLVGHGDATLANAVDRYNATQQEGKPFGKVVENIMNVWTTVNYAETGRPWVDACKAFVAGRNWGELNKLRLAVETTFLDAPTEPEEDSHNYGLLIKWNQGGTDFLQCGTANETACP